METNATPLRNALRRVHEILLDTRSTVRLSDVRLRINDAARVAEQALAPTEPTPLELRTALRDLARTPAVRQAMGATHTASCGCPLCVAEGLLR